MVRFPAISVFCYDLDNIKHIYLGLYFICLKSPSGSFSVFLIKNEDVGNAMSSIGGFTVSKKIFLSALSKLEAQDFMLRRTADIHLLQRKFMHNLL